MIYLLTILSNNKHTYTNIPSFWYCSSGISKSGDGSRGVSQALRINSSGSIGVVSSSVSFSFLHSWNLWYSSSSSNQ